MFGPYWLAEYVLKKYNQVEYFSGNGFDFVRFALNELNITHIKVEKSPVGDHYSPDKKMIGLTEKNCGKRSLTAVVVAAHELGHAIQDDIGYKPLHIRMHLANIAEKMRKLGFALIILMPFVTLITRVPAAGFFSLLTGLLIVVAPVFVHLITLPVEFNASFEHAIPLLVKGNYIPEDDYPAAKRILLACSFTYVASSLFSILYAWRRMRIR